MNWITDEKIALVVVVTAIMGASFVSLMVALFGDDVFRETIVGTIIALLSLIGWTLAVLKTTGAPRWAIIGVSVGAGLLSTLADYSPVGMILAIVAGAGIGALSEKRSKTIARVPGILIRVLCGIIAGTSFGRNGFALVVSFEGDIGVVAATTLWTIFFVFAAMDGLRESTNVQEQQHNLA